MTLLRGILDRTVLVVSVVIAGCVPGFIAQYRQRLGGRLDQVLQDLSLFQNIANRYHGGNLAALIRHHLDSTDKTFHDEGIAIQTMVDTVARLRNAVQALNTDLPHQLAYLSRSLDPSIGQATWDSYVPAFSITVESVMFSILVGISIWLVFMLAWIVISAITEKIKYPRRA